MKIIRTNCLLQGYKAMTIGPFIFCRPTAKLSDIDINHEEIHWHQEKEMLIIFFLIWYLIEFLIRWISYLNFNRAYKNIGFEVEAYENEKNLEYLKNREQYSWIKYL